MEDRTANPGTGSRSEGPPKEVLRQSEERFRVMVESVMDYGIFMLDPDGYVASWNEGAERIKGYRADEIIGKHFSTFYPPEALARDWPAHELRVARKEGRFEDEGWRVRKDGSRFWANVVITALWTGDGEMIGFTKVTRDLTERKRHEEQLRESERRLERTNLELAQRNSDLQDFAHVASHDLQEPLRRIRTFSELLDTEYRDVLDEEARQYVDRICASTQRMSTLISDLLSYSRLATPTESVQPVDLNRVVEEVTGDLQILLEETGGHVERGALPTVKADPTQMRQLFQNLIGNALKFHRPGVPPLVRVGAGQPPVVEEPGGRSLYAIVVEDNGIGFDEKYAGQIFAPFQRLHTRRQYAGSGLGLAICKRIVERHEGSLSARSRPGEGTVFTVHLPV